jgi:hypothetical protein
MTKLLNDPALLVGLVRSILILLISFGVAVTQAQQDSILMFVGAVLAVVSIVLTGVTRAVTTPTANPVLPTGTTVNVTTPKGQADYLKTV